MKKLFRYFRVYSYGDCVEEYLIVANSKDEAINKLQELKVKNNLSNTKIKTNYLSEVSFDDDIGDLT